MAAEERNRSSSASSASTCPVVAGAAALLRGLGVRAGDVLTTMHKSADACDACDFNSGGRLDVGAAVAIVPVKPTATPTPGPGPTPVPGGCYRLIPATCAP